MKRTIGSLAVILFSITSAYSQTSVTLTVIDELMNYQDVRFKGAFSDWALVQSYDDGTNGDLVAGDGHWTAVIENVNAGSYEWGAIDTDNGDGTTCSVCDGSDGWGHWILDDFGLPNQEFTVDENGFVSGVTSIPPLVADSVITKTVIFNVDMTEWLDQDGATGMPIFSVARGDQMQVRGAFNLWNCDEPADCEMVHTPGTNIFS